MTQSIAGLYAETVHENLLQYATWPLGSKIDLGDYGTLQGRQFKKIGNLQRDFAIQLNSAKSPTVMVFEFKSAGIKEIRLGAGASASPVAGGMPAQGNAKTTLTFQKADSVYFRAIRVVPSAIDNLAQVGDSVMSKFQKGAWKGNYAFVHNVFTAGGTTVLVSSNDDATIEFEASAATQVDLADINCGLSVTSEQNLAFKMIADSKFVPLFSLSQVRPRYGLLPWLFPKTVQTLMSTAGLSQAESTPISADTLVHLTPEITPDLAKQLKKRVDEVFQVVEIP